MELHFAKWHGTGNDFIMIDDRSGQFNHDVATIERLCHRHYGIGADGLIALRKPHVADTEFHMEFYNPDGSTSFCGNGSRCVFAFWSSLNGGVESARFTAIDGVHVGSWRGDDVAIGLPAVRMDPVRQQEQHVDFINTGSPHTLVWVDNVDAVDILEEAPPRRYSQEYGTGGTNVNFVEHRANGIRIRTYERGVEAETLSCGSGVVAAALSAMAKGHKGPSLQVEARGGTLRVEAVQKEPGHFEGIFLIGPAREVFHGVIQL